MKTNLKRSPRRCLGATTTETVLLIVLVAMVVMAGIKLFAGGVGEKVEFANDSIGAVSTEDDEMERLRENAREAKAERAARGGAASSTTTSGDKKSSKKSSEGVASAPDSAKPSAPASAGPDADARASAGGCGGTNPFLIPIVLGLLGLLGYVMAKSRKG